MKKALVLFSGGVDSTTCLALATERFGKDNVTALSVSYGQKHTKELEAARKIAEYYGVKQIEIDLSKIFESSNCSLLKHSTAEIPHSSYADQQKDSENQPVSTYVPFRNGLFIACAASIAIANDCSYLYYGAHRDDSAGNAYPDCSEEFNTAMNTAVFEGSGKQLEIIAPFIDKSKKDIVAVGLSLNVPYKLTWSCYEGGSTPCGKCGTCIDRKKAFEANGIQEDY
ncbi:MAG: 7-cyano-7-deazaguanine synthase QueC [Acutalibacteraceae bacterium]|nr:7-cyano-7-deazaguanine synthase QueC [Acutalibacteraceae bacterium]